MALSLGTNGARGLLADLGPSEALDLGYGFGLWCKRNFSTPKNEKRHLIALARDMRLTSPMLFEAAASGIMEAGCDVLDIGLLPSPAAEWASEHFACDGLIIVTASHNPPEWNALKFVDSDGVAVSKERGGGISAHIGKARQKPLAWNQAGTRIAETSAIEKYSEAVLSFVDRKAIASKKRFKIIFDPGNGTSTLVAPALLRSLGAEVIVINEKLDGTFPGRPSEPTEKNVAGLIGRVKTDCADFGVACDGDSDRVVFVDEKGRWLVGDKCVALHSGWALSKLGSRAKGSTVVTTVATSRVVEDVAARFGAKVKNVKVGAPYIAEVMLSENAAAGGEEVGGIVYPEFSLAKDGILAAAMMMEMVAQKPLSAWHDSLPKYFNAKTKIECKPELKQKILAKLTEVLSSAQPARVNLLDGIRLDFEDSWVIVRASGTENIFRVFAEAKTGAAAESLMNKLKHIVIDVINGV